MRHRELFTAPLRRREALLTGLAGVGAAAAGLSAAPARAALDLNDPKTLLDSYVRVVGDTSGAEAVIYGFSQIYREQDGDRGQHLFDLAVVGVRRYEPIAGGWRRIQREIALYIDPESGAILEQWDNPMNGRRVAVVHVQNDPVNRDHVIDNQGGGWGIDWVEMGGWLVMQRHVLLRYPNPLPPADYPLYSGSDWYVATELFGNFARMADLSDSDAPSVPSAGSWSRFGPWLPWMEMGDAPGRLIYSGASIKLMGGVADLPDPVLRYIADTYPKYLSAPAEWQSESETSWTFFKKRIDADRGEK